MGLYTRKKKTLKWKMAAFYYIIDRVRINIIMVMALNYGRNPKSIRSLDIGWNLSMSLILPHVQRMVLQFSIVKAVPTPTISDQYPKQEDSRKRCHMCLQNISGSNQEVEKDKLAWNKTFCQRSSVPIYPHLLYQCNKHTVV